MDWFSRRFSPMLLGAYFGTDEGGEGGSETTTETKAEEATSQEQAAAKTFDEAYVKQLRSEAAANRKKAAELEQRLQSIEDERKPELQRLQERAERAATLEQERDALQAEAEGLKTALGEVVEEQRKRLAALDKDMLDLLPDGSPTAQLAWLVRAVAKAEKDAKDRKGALPPAGGRNPGAGNGKQEPTDAERQAHAIHMATRF